MDILREGLRGERTEEKYGEEESVLEKERWKGWNGRVERVRGIVMERGRERDESRWRGRGK